MLQKTPYGRWSMLECNEYCQNMENNLELCQTKAKFISLTILVQVL